MLARPNLGHLSPRHTPLAWAALILAALLMLAATWILLAPSSGLSKEGVAATLNALPLQFEPNAGQADRAVGFVAHGSAGTLLFSQSGVVIVPLSDRSPRPGSRGASRAGYSGQASNSGARGTHTDSVVSLQFVGANRAPEMANGRALPGKVNYLLGKDESNWHRNLPTYADFSYRDLYPGVTLGYAGTGGDLKGTYTLAPGADPAQIRWRYAGAEHTAIEASGDLRVTFAATGASSLPSDFSLTEHAPLAWQEVQGVRVPVNVTYRLDTDGTIGFSMGTYDHSVPLTIDPTITYSTYLGGFYGDGAGSIWLDGAGNIYIGGTTTSSDFPVAGQPYQPVYGGGDYDMFASKLSPDGSTLIYSTFIGGGDWDVGGLAGVDTAGIATLGGWTASEDFPTTPGAYQTTFAGTEDVALARLSADGSGLIFGSYWGDEGVDESYGFAVDSAGNTYFTGYWYPGFSSWAFVAALTPDGTQQLFRRNLGGAIPGPGDQNANTSGEGIVVDGAGNIYVTGYTRAADFPTTPGAYSTSIQAFEDGFITKLAPRGTSIIYSTYINGGVSDYPADIALDADGSAYITGNTSSSDYRTTTGAFQRACGDPRCAFLTKLNPAGSALVYSSFLGGPDFHFETEDYGLVVRVNSAGNAYVGGYTSAPDFPVVNAIQASLHGTSDGFLAKFNPSGSGVEYSTYLGGSSGDSVGGIALDGLGHVYLAGSTSSTNFPTLNPLQSANHGGSDAFVVVVAEDGALTVTPTPSMTGTPPTATRTPDPCLAPTAWRDEVAMPVAHSNSAAAVLDNRLYVIGGASNSPTPVRYTQAFDPVSNSWSNRAPYPDGVGLAYEQAASLNGKIYTVGDTYQPGESFIEMYDPATDSWSRRATLPEPLLGGALAAYSGMIYVVGGQVPNGFPSAHVYEYDPVTNTFTSRAPMPTGQAEIGAVAIGNRIYAVGGYQYIHYAYDPEANSWSTIAAPLTPTFSNAGVSSMRGELWVIGGYDNWTRRGYPPSQEVQIYNPATNTWRYGPAPSQPRYFSTAVGVINDRAYLVGGIDLNSNTYPYTYLGSMESIAYASCGTATVTTTALATATATTTSTAIGISSPTAATGTATRTATGTGTPTNSSPTPTSVARSSPTMIATGTPCAIYFSDVQPTDYFYSAVLTLNCRGAISGYADGTFRPYNTTTRGQLAKIVVLAEGWAINVTGGPHFTDVPATNPFYGYIETSINRGIISGYSDGTFRWGNSVTRAQLSKVIVAAQRWTIDTRGGPHFSDVPGSDPFYGYIETAYNRGLISGYSNGAFRPGNSATRGQIAKIVYLAVTSP